ncbi:MAG TPA: alpha/beta fold hydrolase [Planctomycetota bacterium]|nr:alpha/beta fold hydrolase [Planctomycetota bacterium]
MGHGRSTRLAAGSDDYTSASNARDLPARLDALDFPQATVVGRSFRGGVAQALAAASPDRVTALALVASVGPRVAGRTEHTRPLDRELRSRAAPFVLAWVARVPALSWETTHSRVARAFGPGAEIPNGWTIRTQAALSLPGTLHTLSAEVERASPDALAPERITQQTLVLHGTTDRVVLHAVGATLAAPIPGPRGASKRDSPPGARASP